MKSGMRAWLSYFDFCSRFVGDACPPGGGRLKFDVEVDRKHRYKSGSCKFFRNILSALEILGTRIVGSTNHTYRRAPVES